MDEQRFQSEFFRTHPKKYGILWKRKKIIEIVRKRWTFWPRYCKMVLAICDELSGFSGTGRGGAV